VSRKKIGELTAKSTKTTKIPHTSYEQDSHNEQHPDLVKSKRGKMSSIKGD
jgi:hypothetical protein